MFKDLGGEKETVMGLVMNLPPVGFVWNRISQQLEPREIYETSAIPEEQVWKPIPLPDNYDIKRSEEIRKQESDSNFYDPELEGFRRDMWDRRLNGMWMRLNGKPVYITGAHFFYLNFIHMDIGLPDYRDPDRKFFYFWRYAEQDPECLGIFEVTGRRGGKSSRAGSVGIERTTRNKRFQCGIQSKTLADGKVFFEQRIVLPYKSLVDFFCPVTDLSKGDMPAQRLSFAHPSVRKSRTVKRKPATTSQELKDRDELRSSIEVRDSGMYSFDGYKMQTYICDETGKTELDVHKRHNVIKPSLTKGSTQRVIGKALYTTTVEDITNITDCLRLWKDSDPANRGETGRTKSGLYKFFTPADELDNFDAYGMPDREMNRKFILADRKAETNMNSLNDLIRKNPLSESEAFRTSSEKCIFNLGFILAGMDRLQFMKEEHLYERGNIKFVNNILGGDTYWEEDPQGRWKLAIGLEPHEINRYKRIGDRTIPNNSNRFAVGVDPFDHQHVADDGRKSKGAISVYQLPDSFDLSSDRFVCQYNFRQDTPQEFYKDILATCFFFGTPFLCENQKPWAMQWLEEQGFADWFIWLPGAPTPGINANTTTKQEGANEIEEYIKRNYLRHPFMASYEEWKDFRIEDSKKFDITMSEKWALVAAKKNNVRNSGSKENAPDIRNYFRKKKIKIAQ